MLLLSQKNDEEINQKKVRNLLRSKENKKCFDCPTKGPAFVNTTIQTFVCARCSGLVREVGHRVKAISASKFSGPEVLALEHGGNEVARQIWLSNYSTHDSPEPETDADVRAFMRQKYYETKWLNAASLQAHKEKVRDLIYKNFDENGVPLVINTRRQAVDAFSQVSLIANEEMNIMQKDDGLARSTHHHVPSSPASPISLTSPYVLDSPDRFSESANQLSFYQHNLPHTELKNPPMYYLEQNEIGNVLHRRNSSRQSNYSNHDSFTTTSGSIRNSMDSNITDLSQADNAIIEQHHSTVTALSNPIVAVPESSKSMPMLNLNRGNQNPDASDVKPPSGRNTMNVLNQGTAPAYLMANPTSKTLPLPSSAVVLPAPVNNDIVIPTPTASTKRSSSTFDDIISDLAGLKLHKTVRRATYTGGILSPTAVTPSVSANLCESKDSAPASMNGCEFFAALNKRVSFEPPTNDQYAALREVPTSTVPTFDPKEIGSNDSKKTGQSSTNDDEEDQWDEFCSSTTILSNEDFENGVILTDKSLQQKTAAADTRQILFTDLDPRAILKQF